MKQKFCCSMSCKPDCVVLHTKKGFYMLAICASRKAEIWPVKYETNSLSQIDYVHFLMGYV